LRCKRGQAFLRSSIDQDAMEERLRQAFSDIKHHLFQHPVPLLSSSPYPLRGLRNITFPITSKIYKVSKSLWQLNFPDRRNALGQYVRGKIFLNDWNWCRKTLYHEALHSVSVFSRPEAYHRVGRRHFFLSEGITEFLAGYLLFKKHYECYQAWKRKDFKECRISYKSQVKLWGAFCNFIKIGVLIKLYFWDSTRTWDDQYRDFLTSIHNAGYPSFCDVFVLEDNSEILFRQECTNNFGIGFQNIMDSLKRSLDFSHIKS